MIHCPYTLPNGITLLESPVWVGPISLEWMPRQSNMLSQERAYCMKVGTRGGEIVLWNEYDLLHDIREDLIAPLK